MGVKRKRAVLMSMLAALCLAEGMIVGFHRGLPSWLGGVSRDDITPLQAEAERLWTQVQGLSRSHGVGDRLDAAAQTLAAGRESYGRARWRRARVRFGQFLQEGGGIQQFETARKSTLRMRDAVIHAADATRKLGAPADAPDQWEEFERLRDDAERRTETAESVPPMQEAEKAWNAAIARLPMIEQRAQAVWAERAAVAAARAAWRDALQKAPPRSVLDAHGGKSWADARAAEADAEAATRSADFLRAEAQYAGAADLLTLAVQALLPDGWTLSPQSVRIASPEGESQKDILYYTNDIDMDFVLIPAGEFMMGSTKTEPGERGNEQPRHKVKLTKSFFMAATEVTQAQYKTVMGKNPSWRRKGDDLPVTEISWNDAVAFCQALSKRDGVRYRLPTEAEWEYACRAGTTTPFSAGETLRPGLANHCPAYGTPRGETYRKELAPVAEYPANPWGLYDMHGNVAEFCQDWFELLYYKRSPGQDPRGPAKGTHRLLRGGVYYDDPTMCRSAFRNRSRPHVPFQSHGIRAVADMPPSSEAL